MPKRRRDKRREERGLHFAAGWGAPEPQGDQARIEAIVAVADEPGAAIEEATRIVSNGIWQGRPVSEWPLSLRCIEVDAAAGRLLRRALRPTLGKPGDDGLPHGRANRTPGRARARPGAPPRADRADLGRLHVGSDGTLRIW